MRTKKEKVDDSCCGRCGEKFTKKNPATSEATRGEKQKKGSVKICEQCTDRDFNEQKQKAITTRRASYVLSREVSVDEIKLYEKFGDVHSNRFEKGDKVEYVTSIFGGYIIKKTCYLINLSGCCETDSGAFSKPD